MTKIKGSQEAHEAIRPALVSTSTITIDTTTAEQKAQEENDVLVDGGDAAAAAAAAVGTTGGGKFLHPTDLPTEGLETQQKALYDLVYRRTLASAMAESEADFTTVSLGAGRIGLEGTGGDEVGRGLTKYNTVQHITSSTLQYNTTK